MSSNKENEMNLGGAEAAAAEKEATSVGIAFDGGATGNVVLDASSGGGSGGTSDLPGTSFALFDDSVRDAEKEDKAAAEKTIAAAAVGISSGRGGTTGNAGIGDGGDDGDTPPGSSFALFDVSVLDVSDNLKDLSYFKDLKSQVYFLEQTLHSNGVDLPDDDQKHLYNDPTTIPLGLEIRIFQLKDTFRMNKIPLSFVDQTEKAPLGMDSAKDGGDSGNTIRSGAMANEKDGDGTSFLGTDNFGNGMVKAVLKDALDDNVGVQKDSFNSKSDVGDEKDAKKRKLDVAPATLNDSRTESMESGEVTKPRQKGDLTCDSLKELGLVVPPLTLGKGSSSNACTDIDGKDAAMASGDGGIDANSSGPVDLLKTCEELVSTGDGSKKMVAIDGGDIASMVQSDSSGRQKSLTIKESLNFITQSIQDLNSKSASTENAALISKEINNDVSVISQKLNDLPSKLTGMTADERFLAAEKMDSILKAVNELPTKVNEFDTLGMQFAVKDLQDAAKKVNKICSDMKFEVDNYNLQFAVKELDDAAKNVTGVVEDAKHVLDDMATSMKKSVTAMNTSAKEFTNAAADMKTAVQEFKSVKSFLANSLDEMKKSNDELKVKVDKVQKDLGA